MLLHDSNAHVPRWLQANPVLLGRLKSYMQGFVDNYVRTVGYGEENSFTVSTFFHGDWNWSPQLLPVWEHYLHEHNNEWEPAFTSSAQAVGHVFKQMLREHPNQFEQEQGFKSKYFALAPYMVE
jgi:hypothetical protein